MAVLALDDITKITLEKLIKEEYQKMRASN